MKIIAKSGVSKGQLQDRLRKGADYLELHLEESDIDTAEKKSRDNNKYA